MRYVVKRAVNWEDDEDEKSSTANAVLEPEDDAISTGLLDSLGRPLYRVPGRIKMGYVK